MPHSLRLFRFPTSEYRSAWDWQRRTADDVRNGAPDALAGKSEHPPVYTFGRRVRPEHLLASAADLQSRGADLVESDRGGDITFHGPGQIVGYPILDLKRHALRPADYVCLLEESLILTLDRFGLRGERVSGRTGVWINNDKIAAMGVRVQGGVTTHGFALNVEPDLSWFDAIVPCGIADAGVTSMQRELGTSPGIAAVEDILLDSFAAVFGVEYVPASSNLSQEPILTHGR